MQYSFSNIDAVPLALRKLNCKGSETGVESKDRKETPVNGKMFISPVEKCFIGEFPDSLIPHGYSLVDAFFQARVDAKDPTGRRKYYMVRFLFAQERFAEPSEEFLRVRDLMLAALREMCASAYWRVRAFSNPVYINGLEIYGQRAMSINLEARQPLLQPDGKPVVEWEKDEAGRRVGTTPVPIKPNRRLCISNGVVDLV